MPGIAELDKIPTILTNAVELGRHVHNRERWFGLAAAPSGTNFGDEATLLPYVAISGAGVFGADANDEANVIGTDDTPAIAGMTKYDIHRILVVTVDNVTPWVLRIVYGSGTMGDAEAAGQYTDVMVIAVNVAGPIEMGSPFNVLIPKIDCGVDKVWIRAKNATNNDEIDFFVGIHEYED